MTLRIRYFLVDNLENKTMKLHNNKILILLAFTLVYLLIASCDKAASNAPTTGMGGSMARFAIVHDYLYVVDKENLKVYDVSNPAQPEYVKDIEIGQGIETIFPYKDYLFIGAENGMYAYDITIPFSPEYISKMIHVVSCDPVVVNDTLAFVTLRSGGDCRINSGVNQLEIIDISNISHPVVIRRIPMDTPMGLGIDGELLFICHGEYGLGIYDFSKLDTLHTVHRINDIKTYDVIPHNNILLVIGESGFYQYSYADLDNIVLLSHIPVAKKKK
jgi:hypothetical protein